MMAFITGPFWTFLKGIPAKVWLTITVIAAALVGIYIVDGRARQEERQKARAKRNEDARKVDNKILENSDDMVNQADRIRAANPVEPDPPAGVPREPLPKYHYRD